MDRKTKVKIGRFQKKTARMVKKLGGMAIGALLLAISYNAFVLPYGLLSGGVGGLSLITKYEFGIPLYEGIFVLNIPIFLWGLKELDRKFMFYSLVGDKHNDTCNPNDKTLYSNT